MYFDHKGYEELNGPGVPMADWKSTHGPDTYLNGARYGWPHDHSVDDTYECPPHTWVAPKPLFVGAADQAEYEREQRNKLPDTQFIAEFTGSGDAVLLKVIKTTYARFDTFADAKLAAEALNNHKGY